MTTSWDDGHKMDLKLSALLDKYNLKGTFYLSKTGEYRTLIDKEIQQIAKHQEIGAHALNHNDLTKLSLTQAEREIIGSKEYLENILNQPIKMFSYPRGQYNQEIKKIVQKTGFLGARTVKDFCFQEPEDFFETGATIHIYPFPFRKRNKERYHISRFLFQPLGRSLFKIVKSELPLSSFLNWSNLAKNLFDYTCQNGGVYHLWGHSWEIEKYGMWEDLENIFEYIANKKNIEYLTNREMLEQIKK